MRLHSLIKLLLSYWAALILVLTSCIAKWESKLADLRIIYNVQPSFASPKIKYVCTTTAIFLQEYPGNPPARAAPEPKGPL